MMEQAFADGGKKTAHAACLRVRSGAELGGKKLSLCKCPPN